MARIIRSISALACATALAASCHESARSPFSPSPPDRDAPGPAPSPPPAGANNVLFGTVTAAGSPVAGARVAVLEMQPEPTATTDGGGRYRVEGVPPSSFWGRTLVRVSQPGYFTVFKRPEIHRDTQLDVVLDPLGFVNLDETIRGTVTAGDAMCAGKDYEEDVCQRFAVRVSSAGTLEVTLTSTVYTALDVVDPDGTAVAEFNGTPIRVSVPARPGGIYELRVLGERFRPAEFELVASVR